MDSTSSSSSIILWYSDMSRSILLCSFLPKAWIATTMHHSNYDYRICPDSIIDTERKPMKQCPPSPSVDGRVHVRSYRNRFECRKDTVEKLLPQARVLRFIPSRSVGQVFLSFRPKSYLQGDRRFLMSAIASSAKRP